MARIGGAFPFPVAQLAEGQYKIQLGTGGVFYLPAGEGLVNVGAASALEMYDPNAQRWRTLIPASGGVYGSFDGTNQRLHNLTGCVTSTTISNAGSGMTNGIGATATGVSVGIAASDTTGGITATAFAIVGGSVAAPTITTAGSGFLTPPLVVIDPPPLGGIQATAVAALTAAGAITSITMVNVGAGYAASPQFWLIPQPSPYPGGPSGGVTAGTLPPPGLVNPANAVPGNQNTDSTNGALLTSIALTGSGTLTGLIMVRDGTGYTTASPAVTFTGGAGGVAASVTVGTTTPANDVSYYQPRVQ